MTDLNLLPNELPSVPVICRTLHELNLLNGQEVQCMHCHADAVCFASSTKALDSISIRHCKMKKKNQNGQDVSLCC